MAPKTMALLDTKEQLHLIDVPSEEELEVSDLSSIGLCYNSSLYKALATGGNVSELLVSSSPFYFFLLSVTFKFLTLPLPT